MQRGLNAADARLANAMGKLARAKENPNQRRIRMLLTEEDGTYTKDDLAFLEPLLFETDCSPREAVELLEVLCKANQVAELLERLKAKYADGNHLPPVVEDAVMRIAERQGDAETIAGLAMESKRNLGRAMLALKRMGKEDFLVQFLFSEDENIVKLAEEIASR